MVKQLQEKRRDNPCSLASCFRARTPGHISTRARTHTRALTHAEQAHPQELCSPLGIRSPVLLKVPSAQCL